MNTITHAVRRLLVLSVFSIGLASLAQAGQQQFAGPRNTIPQTQTRTQMANHSSERLRASTDNASVCSAVRIKHYGHPGKGVNRIEGRDAPCGKSRLSTR